ncbi:MAG: hypothetical protein KAI47_20965 [Deltaproteobacteria bacterium]|nr:hypothetical protein [Deltaproteobacteria bacterium]
MTCLPVYFPSDRLLAAVLFVGLASVVGLSACASREFVCPDPIGKIFRDDCAAYRTRFDTLKATLSAGVGPINASVSLGKESLRDPSQLMQILAHRTFALCRDFNACRVPSAEYRERRERIDHVFTAVGAISAQLKQALPKEEKARLVAKLVSLLSADRPSPRPGRKNSVRPQRQNRPRLVHYSSWLPWYGTKILPPQPKTRGPWIAATRFSVRHVFRSGQGAVGYGLRVGFLLRGKFRPDGLFTMRYGRQLSDCRISRGKHGPNGLTRLSCKTPRKEALTASALPLTLRYDAAGDGKARLLGRRVFHVLSRITNPKNGSRTFAEDHDGEARRLRLIFRPVGRGLPPSYEQPSLYAVLKLRDHKHKTVTARCWVDGKRLGSAVAAYGRYSGQAGQFQDRSRYKKVAPGKSVSVRFPFVTWRRYDFRLPFYVRHTGRGDPPKGLKAWPVAGRWRCVVSFEGAPVRETRFVVRSDGRLESIAAQERQPAAAWLLNTVVIPSKYEEPLR